MPGRNQDENSITCFIQDREGFLWIGSKAGLYRYDGYDFTLFRTDPKQNGGLQDNYIRCLAEHSEAELIFIGTDRGGLNVYHKHTDAFSHYLHDADDPESIGGNAVFDMVEDENGTLWIATLDGGLNAFDTENQTFKRYLLDPVHQEDPDGKSFKSLCLDGKYHLLAGTRTCGLYRFDIRSGTFDPIRDRAGRVRPVEIWSIARDSNNDIWLGTQNTDVVRIRRDGGNEYTFEHIEKAHGFRGRSALKVFCDSEGTLWAGAWAGGLFRKKVNEIRFKRFQPNGEDRLSLSGYHVLSVFEDNAGTIWVGTHARGINMIQPEKWKFYPHAFSERYNYGLIQNEVRSIHYREDDRSLWLGTVKGLLKLNTETGDVEHFDRQPDTETGILHEAVNAIVPAATPNALWIGTPIGFSLMDTKHNTFRHYPSSAVDASAPLNINIHQMLLDGDNILWLGTSQLGLVRFDPIRETFRRFVYHPNDASSISPWIVRELIPDGEAGLILGTSHGLQRFDKKKETFEDFSERSTFSGLHDVDVTALYRSGDRTLWIGTTYYGLIRYDLHNDSASYFTESDGLASNNVCGIVENGNGRLFISTNNGITSFDPQEVEFRNFHVEDGLHGTEFRDRSYASTPEGIHFFGGVDGFTTFIPEKMGFNAFIPPVYLTRFDVLNADFDADEHIMYTSRIDLNYRMNAFAIEFVSLNFINAVNNEYLYRLEGVDRSWRRTVQERRIVYRNLEPGRYTFEVKGSNNDGVWNEEGDSLIIQITPPFWRTVWFRVSAVILVFGVVFFIVRRKFVVLKRESELRRIYTSGLIQSQEAERKRIAAELHDSLGQDLLVIKNRIHLMLRRGKEKGPQMDQLKKISEIADESIASIRHISYNLHPYQLDKIGLAAAVKSMIHRINEVSKVQFTETIAEIDGCLAKEQEINFYRIIQECTNNILKHSKADSAEVTIERTDDTLHVVIKDDGIGFDTDDVTKRTRGIGLSGVRERVSILHGKIKIASIVGSGTTISIEIPIIRKP